MKYFVLILICAAINLLDDTNKDYRKLYGLSFHRNCGNYFKTFKCMTACKSMGYQVFRLDYKCKCSCHELKTTTILPAFVWRTNGTTKKIPATFSPKLYAIVGTMSPPPRERSVQDTTVDTTEATTVSTITNTTANTTVDTTVGTTMKATLNTTVDTTMNTRVDTTVNTPMNTTVNTSVDTTINTTVVTGGVNVNNTDVTTLVYNSTDGTIQTTHHIIQTAVRVDDEKKMV